MCSKYLKLALFPIFLHSGCAAQVMLLDTRLHYIYADTFALAWKKQPENLGKEMTLEFVITMDAMYGDSYSFTDGLSGDTLVVMSFYREYAERGNAVGFSPRFTRSGKKLHVYYTDSFIFKIRPRSEKIQALIGLLQTNYSVVNLQMLQEAYEEEQCMVNALYILKRIIEKDSKKGWPMFQDFYRRYKSNMILQSVAR
jgi:hypothetical protein